MEPRNHSVTTARCRLEVLDWRPSGGDAAPLFCIHGITANARAFTGIATHLLPEVGCIAVDLCGRGGSDTPAHGYGIPGHVADMLEVLDALELPCVDVVGWSLGSLIAMQLAARAPERVQRLILLDPPLTTPSEVAAASLARGWKRLERTYPDRATALAAWRESPALPANWDAAVEAFVDADLLDLPGGAVGHRMSLETLQAERSAQAPPLSSVVPNIRAQTLILRATDALIVAGDQLLGAEDAQRAVRLFTNATVQDIPGANHYTITLGTPMSTIAAIRAFLISPE